MRTGTPGSATSLPRSRRPSCALRSRIRRTCRERCTETSSRASSFFTTERRPSCTPTSATSPSKRARPCSRGRWLPGWATTETPGHRTCTSAHGSVPPALLGSKTAGPPLQIQVDLYAAERTRSIDDRAEPVSLYVQRSIHVPPGRIPVEGHRLYTACLPVHPANQIRRRNQWRRSGSPLGPGAPRRGPAPPTGAFAAADRERGPHRLLWRRTRQ